MKRTLLALTLAAVSVIVGPISDLAAQEQRVARGTLSAIGSNWITVQVRGDVLKFEVDRTTRVEANGASTKTRQLTTAGKAGPHVGDLLIVGQSVSVSYSEMPGARLASVIRAIPKVGDGSVKQAREMRSIGTVKAIGPESLTITWRRSSSARFTQTFMIAPTTNVVGKGAGTLAAAKGGKAPFRDLIAEGDRVSVTYHQVGDALQASDVRVTMKGAGSH
jgi:hypothetical protein